MLNQISTIPWKDILLHMHKWKKKKPTDNSASSNEDPLERSSKKGQKYHKTVREEEVECLKMQGSQENIEMSINRSTWDRPIKGGPTPSVK